MFIFRWIRKLIFLAILAGVAYFGSSYVNYHGTPVRKIADDFLHSKEWIEGSKDLRTWLCALLRMAGDKVQEGITPQDEQKLRQVIESDLRKQVLPDSVSAIGASPTQKFAPTTPTAKTPTATTPTAPKTPIATQANPLHTP